ncbi:hypothetical protein [Massilia antarctica]|uniref:hypothetical protein n=1 Tax=Massilia antarctica TaxID=2765360 RepID=UPI0006BB71E0|nr:hypothetical protein [Massilia sp. H27-R4]MCY0910434.1 hypothetical protein [Massilia sp. H27-R4]CUI09218.1 hypothetical protein BN2497_13213 [Janthinobacterium sp. CG23_2]CUU33004.1 hypothetical protein BN3177_13213 [Janthinobacterium sp. CG23_2]
MKYHATACLLLAAAVGAQAQTAPMGRLFTTPAERHQLDIQRGLAAAPPAPVVEAASAPQPMTVNGFVRRSSGKSTVWVNNEAREGARNRFSGPAQAPRVTLTLPSGQKVVLKPGQSVDMNAGTVTDVDRP